MSKMKHLLRKLHIGGSVSDHHRLPDTHRGSPSSSPSASSLSSSVGQASSSSSSVSPAVSANSGARMADGDAELRRNGVDEGVDFNFFEEEFQVQLALALSASDPDRRQDAETAQIDAVKRISLGSLPGPVNSALLDFLSLRYWNYNVVNYDEKLTDGFYDVYGIISNSCPQRQLPSFVDLHETSVSDKVDYEVVLVNRMVDPVLQQLEKKVVSIAMECRSAVTSPIVSGLVQKIADLVVDSMGGPVGDTDDMLRRWTAQSHKLRMSLNSIVVPLGCLEVGLSRHRALLFKVLADRVNLPCRLVKGSYYTGTDEEAVNLIKIDEGSEYIIDLMGSPGTLIPAEIPSNHLPKPGLDIMCSNTIEETVKDLYLALDRKVNSQLVNNTERLGGSLCDPSLNSNVMSSRMHHPLTNDVNLVEPHQVVAVPSLGKPPRGSSLGMKATNSPAQKMKVKDVSKYVISAAQNPKFAKKLHAVLLESGASPPADLFSGLNPPQDIVEGKGVRQIDEGSKLGSDHQIKSSLSSTRLESSALDHNKLITTANEKIWANGLEKSSHCSSAKDQSQLSGADLCLISSDVSLPFSSASGLSVNADSSDSEVLGRSAIPDSSAEISGPYGHIMQKTAESNRLGACLERKGSSQIFQMGADESLQRFVETANCDQQNISRSDGNGRINPLLNDVAEFEIPWEDLQIGERIGLGSFGEVYRADWNGTEVAVKKFLDQEFSGDALEQFRCEWHCADKNHAKIASSKCCSFHGCCHPSSKPLNIDRVSSKGKSIQVISSSPCSN
ncbi:probable serine/threonine-protein kinase SIS8 isoform X2 [Aristolochia californica]|uniref:probable serine/threonine-protein kinase SIS8 isoform X2 n=1 Tax=Aristolochia californica TaxID=171875 RepID=UPI0035D6E888